MVCKPRIKDPLSVKKLNAKSLHKVCHKDTEVPLSLQWRQGRHRCKDSRPRVTCLLCGGLLKGTLGTLYVSHGITSTLSHTYITFGQELLRVKASFRSVVVGLVGHPKSVLVAFRGQSS